jgi:hypothetical protein
LYDFNPEHDITAEVVEVLRASMSSKAANNPPAEKQG